MELLLASTNPHKVDEVRAILGPLGIEVVGLEEAAASGGGGGAGGGGGVAVPEPVEDGATFEANAEIKAVYWARVCGRTCLADDSGLEVDALGGAPGVFSARYAEAGATATRSERDAANNRKLLRELRWVPPERRAARFVCAMCLADAAGRVLARTRGVFEGVIATAPAGSNGFGYDPLLSLPDAGCTSAELSPAEKNARSHRGAAARAMAVKLAELAEPAPRLRRRGDRGLS